MKRVTPAALRGCLLIAATLLGACSNDLEVERYKPPGDALVAEAFRQLLHEKNLLVLRDQDGFYLIDETIREQIASLEQQALQRSWPRKTLMIESTCVGDRLEHFLSEKDIPHLREGEGFHSRITFTEKAEERYALQSTLSKITDKCRPNRGHIPTPLQPPKEGGEQGQPAADGE